MKGGNTLNQKRLLRYVLQGLSLGAVATVLVIAFTARKETLEHIRDFSPAFLLLLLGMVATAWLCNGTRIWVMCRAAGYNLSFKQAISVSLSTEFGIAATPAGVGGTVIRLTLLKQAGLSLTTAGSLLAADATIDLVFFGFLTPIAAFVIIHDELLKGMVHEPTGLETALALAIVIAIAACLFFAFRSPTVPRLIGTLAGATSYGRRKRLPARFRKLRTATSRSIRRVFESLKFLWKNRKFSLLLNLAIASLQWTCRYMLLPVVLYSLGSPVNPLPLFLIQGVLFGLSLLIVAPGGGGSVELLSAFVLPVFAPGSLTGVIVLVWRFFSYHLYLLVGGAVFFVTCHRLHRIFPQSGQTTIFEVDSETTKT